MKKKETYPFPKSWQKKLLAIFITSGARIAAEGLIKSEYFERPLHGQIAELVINLYSKYGVPLTYEAVRVAVKNKFKDTDDQQQCFAFLDKLEKVKIRDIERELITDQVKRFASHQAAKIALHNSVSLLEADNLDELRKQWEKAFLVGRGQGIGEEIEYFSDIKQRSQRRTEKIEIIATLIPLLDIHLNSGGFNRKELNVFLGLPGTGKSFALDWVAKAAILQKKKGIFYSLEMSVDRVAARLDASFSGVEIRELRDKEVTVAKKLGGMQRRYGDALIIKSYPAQSVGISAIRNHIIEKKMTGFNPDFIVLDYINLLARDENRSASMYKGLGDVYIGLRALCQEYNLWGITAGQSRRASYDAKLITMKDISESFEGAMHADVIISLNQTETEHQKGILRLFLAKNRNEISGKVFSIRTNFSKGTFYTRKDTSDDKE